MDDPRTKRAPSVIDRRKLLLGLGFGVTNLAVLRQLSGSDTIGSGGGRSEVQTTTTESVRSTTNDLATPSGAGPTVPATIAEATSASVDTVFDTVITNGRVMDPETGYDRIANVGILGASVAHIGEETLEATSTIDAAGQVVAPGFVDILSYSPNGYGEWFKIADGVTTNLAMHGLRFEPDDFYNRWEAEGSPVHFGGSVHSSNVRETLGYDPGEKVPASDLDAVIAANRAQVEGGYLGIHAQPEYSPGMSKAELVRLAEAAADLGVPLTVHARYSDNFEPGTNLEAMTELVNLAKDTGAWVHVEHINSTGGTGVMAEALAMIDDARSGGARMSACMYPYTFWATYLQASRFENWQERYALTYEDLQVAGRAERLTEATYPQAYEDNLLTAAHAIREADLETAIASPFVMIGSDAILETDHNNHPRSTGCFSRTVAEFVRNRRLITLMEALSKMTIQPAKLAELAAPAMRKKGRLQVGSDADIVVFDPNEIADQSTIVDPGLESVGIRHVWVDGTHTLGPQGPIEGARAGTSIRSAL
ncbi:MAG: amidohydrolase family protein [Acidobacteria bacterium]|nr:amidohydrolase family protein [Acidobacteriota bacterium]